MSWSLMAIKGLIQIDKVKASFKNEKKKSSVSPLTLYRVSWVQENNPWIRKSEKGSSRTTVTIYISYERQWQSQIWALTGAPRL